MENRFEKNMKGVLLGLTVIAGEELPIDVSAEESKENVVNSARLPGVENPVLTEMKKKMTPETRADAQRISLFVAEGDNNDGITTMDKKN